MKIILVILIRSGLEYVAVLWSPRTKTNKKNWKNSNNNKTSSDPLQTNIPVKTVELRIANTRAKKEVEVACWYSIMKNIEVLDEKRFTELGHKGYKRIWKKIFKKYVILEEIWRTALPQNGGCMEQTWQSSNKCKENSQI